jgi:hypothetical protein
MEKMRDKDIAVTHHAVDGFTCSYVTGEGDYYHKLCIGYGVKEAKRRFKDYVYAEDAKIFRNTTADDAPVMPVRGLRKGGVSGARELTGR